MKFIFYAYFKKSWPIFLLAGGLIISCASEKPVVQPPPPQINHPAVTIAVINFGNYARNNNKPLMSSLNSFLSARLLQAGNFRIVERNKIDRIIEEMKMNLSGITGNDQLMQLGQMAGAQYLVLGSFLNQHDFLMVNARIVSVETTEAVVVENISGKQKDGIRLMESLAKKLVNRFQFALAR